MLSQSLATSLFHADARTPEPKLSTKGRRGRVRRHSSFEREETNEYPPSMNVREAFDLARSEESAVTTLLVLDEADNVRADVRPSPEPDHDCEHGHPALPGLPPLPESLPDLERQLAVVSLAPGDDLDDPAWSAVDRNASDDPYLHTITDVPGFGWKQQSGSLFRGVTRLSASLCITAFIAAGLLAAGAIAYMAMPELVLAVAAAGGLVLLCTGAIVLYLFGLRSRLAAGTGMALVAVLALAVTWCVRIGFPAGLAEGVFAMTPANAMANLQVIAATGMTCAASLLESYLPVLWAIEVAVLSVVALRCFRLLRS